MTKKRIGLGARGEEIAAEYLCSHGYRLLVRNYRCPLGEIDLVAQKDGCLIICEVKTRSGREAGHPLEAVTPAKRERLRKLGDYYWNFETKRDLPLRFDVLAVQTIGGSPHVDHVVDAF